MRYQRRPEIVRAERWTPERGLPGVETATCVSAETRRGLISHGTVETQDGVRIVHDGDWVVWAPGGKIEVYSPEGFTLRFEPVPGRAGGA